GAVLNVTTILGGVEIIVPENVQVEIKGTPILGGWENKTNTYGMEKNKILYINGVALLGGIEIKHELGDKKMNEKAKNYWLDYWNEKGEVAPTNVTAWQFGVDADYLAKLVVDGIKTATCSGHI